MTPKEKLQKILKQHKPSPEVLDSPLFMLRSPYCLHTDLAEGSPYLEEGNQINEAYVAECLNLAENMYNGLHVGTDLLIVYEDCYSEREQENIFFFESCLKGIGQTESYCFSWKFSPMKETYPAALANNQDVHVCTRRLYEAKDIDTRRLFLEIICSDIGGKYDLASKVFILDMAVGCLFHLYDDRGLWVSKPAEKRAK